MRRPSPSSFISYQAISGVAVPSSTSTTLHPSGCDHPGDFGADSVFHLDGSSVLRPVKYRMPLSPWAARQIVPAFSATEVEAAGPSVSSTGTRLQLCPPSRENATLTPESAMAIEIANVPSAAS